MRVMKTRNIQVRATKKVDEVSMHVVVVVYMLYTVQRTTIIIHVVKIDVE